MAKLVQILGPGCPKCKETYDIVSQAVAESGADVTIEKITDFKEIAQMGVFTTPAVVVDGEIKVVGRAPKKSEVAGWL